MSEAPQRMSIYPLEGTWDYGGFEFAQGDEPNKVEYVRADRIEELEAKLAKAVETLEKLDVGEGWAAQIARTTLAELLKEEKT